MAINAPITTRAANGIELTWQQMDGNLISMQTGIASAGAQIDAFKAPTGSTLLGIGGGRTQADKNAEIVSVKDFGAKGGGVTDDTAAFASADALGRPYFVPAGTYKITQNFFNTAFSYGGVIFTGGGGVALIDVTKSIRLPINDALFEVSNTSQLNSPQCNVVTNAHFYVWPSGMATSISAAGDAYVCGNWRMKSHSTATVAGIGKINSINGGLKFAATFGPTADYVYVRQLVPNVIALSGRTFTFSADVEIDVACDVDLYIQARLNSSDATRVLVTDTPNLSLAAGRHRVAGTFTVPDIASLLSTVDVKNSLEFAFRLYGQDKVVNCNIYEIIVSPGEEVTANSVDFQSRDNLDVELFYETGTCQIVGMNTTSGQKRFTAPFRTKKQSLALTVTISDIVGNVGKISIYDVSGTRTDNVTPTAISQTQDGVTVILNASTAAGIGFNYTANCYS